MKNKKEPFSLPEILITVKKIKLFGQKINFLVNQLTDDGFRKNERAT